MSTRIKKCLIGAKYTEETNELNKLGIETVAIPESPDLDEEINNHADILAFKLSDKKLIISSSIIGELTDKLKGYDLFSCNDIHSPYPSDVKLNCALIGNYFVCNTSTVSPILLDWAKKQNYTIISTKQGYTKCNLCILNNTAVITEDKGLSSLLKKYQIDVLEIHPGYINLSEKHYGFIGGASMRISDTEIYFSGDISLHPDFNEIIYFLNKYNFNAIYNSNRPLRDFGGFIPIN